MIHHRWPPLSSRVSRVARQQERLPHGALYSMEGCGGPQSTRGGATALGRRVLPKYVQSKNNGFAWASRSSPRSARWGLGVGMGYAECKFAFDSITKEATK